MIISEMQRKLATWSTVTLRLLLATIKWRAVCAERCTYGSGEERLRNSSTTPDLLLYHQLVLRPFEFNTSSSFAKP